MKTLQNDHYAYRVIWSDEDKEHVGLCDEFPSLSWVASTPEEALRGIRKIVAESVADMKKNAEHVPEPVSTKSYSGKFMVRVPPFVHLQLALEAVEAKISLNRLANAKLLTSSWDAVRPSKRSVRLSKHKIRVPKGQLRRGKPAPVR